MTTCDYFERRYRDWKEGRTDDRVSRLMREHAATCAHCGALDPSTARMREVVAELPRYRPSNGFEFRLHQRIAAVDGTVPAKARPERTANLPGWAALGAGLATGLALGLILLLPSSTDEPNKTPGFKLPAMVAENAPVQDLADTVREIPDTVRLPETGYNPDRHSRVVSSDR